MSPAPGLAPAALGLGVIQTPIGTREEIEEVGLDPRQVACCAKPGPGAPGCAQYDRCIFRYTNNGGFRDHGPRNIGYYFESSEGGAKEDQCLCSVFMGCLYDRMEEGAIARRRGLRGDLIEVIAQEGEEIWRTQIVNANAETPGAKERWVKETKPVAVSRFPRPSERLAIAGPGKVYRRRMERDKLRDDWREGLPPEERPRVAHVATVEEIDPVDAAVAARVAEMEAMTVPADEKPRRGRPRSSAAPIARKG
jgi:hypothetical protein